MIAGKKLDIAKKIVLAVVLIGEITSIVFSVLKIKKMIDDRKLPRPDMATHND